MQKSEIFLGIETGGTKTIAIAATPELRKIARVECGPANLRLISDKDFLALLRESLACEDKPMNVG
jgi:N-acetylglucosamine kinase-like BadF-type ATPase